MSKAQDLFKHALEVIPYGTQLQSKHPNSFAPGKYEKFIRIPFDPMSEPEEQVDWEQ